MASGAAQATDGVLERRAALLALDERPQIDARSAHTGKATLEVVRDRRRGRPLREEPARPSGGRAARRGTCAFVVVAPRRSWRTCASTRSRAGWRSTTSTARNCPSPRTVPPDSARAGRPPRPASQASADEAIRKLQPPLTFDALPQELVVLIMRGGSPRSTLALSACSRALRAASLLDEVWRAHLLEMGFIEAALALWKAGGGSPDSVVAPESEWPCCRDAACVLYHRGCTRESSSAIASRGGGKAARSLWPAWNSQTHSTCRCGPFSCLAASRRSTPAHSRRGRRATASSCFRRASTPALPVTEGTCTARAW